MSRCHIEGLHSANCAALLQHIPTTDTRCEQSDQLISGWRCLLMFHPAGFQQVGTHQNSAGVFACLCLFHTFLFFFFGLCFFFFFILRKCCSAAGRQADSQHVTPQPIRTRHKVFPVEEWRRRRRRRRCGLHRFFTFRAKQVLQTQWYSDYAWTAESDMTAKTQTGIFSQKMFMSCCRH